MAERRMFAKTIIDSDAFLDMPMSTQSLYFHLSMRADDDGFVNNPKRVARLVGSAEDDLKILEAKRYVLLFKSGVLVIKHWKIHNYIQKDRYKPTLYSEEMAQIVVKENKSYTECLGHLETLDTRCIQDVSTTDTDVIQSVRLGKSKSKSKVSLELEGEKSKKISPSPKKQLNKFIPEEEKPKQWGVFPGDKTLPENPDNKPDKPTDPLSGQIQSMIDYWNDKGNLPNCPYNVLMLPNIADINNVFAAYKKDKVKAAIDNLAMYWDKENYKPTSFQRFIVNSVDRWVDDCQPWTRYDDSKAGMSPLEKELQNYEEMLQDFKDTISPEDDLYIKCVEKIAELKKQIEGDKTK